MGKEMGKKDVNVQFRQLEALILLMAGATLASLLIIHYTFLSQGPGIAALQMFLDWLFGVSIIFMLVHFSFREIKKMYSELIIQREQASKSERRMKHIIDMTQDVIFTLDQSGNITFTNKTIEVLTGYPISQLLQSNIQMILTKEYETFVAEQLRQYRNVAGRHLYIDVRKKDGSIVPVEFSFIAIRSKEDMLIGYQGIMRDCSERKEIEKVQREKEQYLKAIARVGQILLDTGRDPQYKKILELVCHASQMHDCFIFLKENDVRGVSASCAADEKSVAVDFDSSTVIKPGMYIHYSNNNHNDGSNSTKTIDALLDDEQIKQSLAYMATQEGAIYNTSKGEFSTLILPLMVHSQFAGIAGFNKPSSAGGWKPVEINLLATVANMLSQAIERKQTDVHLKDHFVQLTGIISKALFAVDPYTVSHQERLALLACCIGEKCGLNDEELGWLKVGALLHDIGKAAVPSTILSKSGKLTDEEWNLVRSHVKRGYEMLQGANLPDKVINMVLNHHERLDGSGYPNGVQADHLSVESRILEVCDVVEAMSSHRPYRPARSKEEILAEINNGKDTLYDSRVVDILIEMVEKDEVGFFASLQASTSALKLAFA